MTDNTCDRLVFTDLDGSLLDHHDYNYEAARPALAALRQRGIPVVLVSSKTRAEIESLRLELGNNYPFIVENGAAVYIPAGTFESLPEDCRQEGDFTIWSACAPRAHWQGLLDQLAGQFAGEFRSFHRAGIAGICSMTGLSPEQAERANDRAFSEPVQWLGSSVRRREFLVTLRELGANPVAGGRFISVSGDCDKGQALCWLRDRFEAQFGARPVTLAIGDSDNDLTMLEAADTALLIRAPGRPLPLLMRQQGILISRGEGPIGWADGVFRWLESATAASTEDSHG